MFLFAYVGNAMHHGSRFLFFFYFFFSVTAHQLQVTLLLFAGPECVCRFQSITPDGDNTFINENAFKKGHNSSQCYHCLSELTNSH